MEKKVTRKTAKQIDADDRAESLECERPGMRFTRYIWSEDGGAWKGNGFAVTFAQTESNPPAFSVTIYRPHPMHIVKQVRTNQAPRTPEAAMAFAEGL